MKWIRKWSFLWILMVSGVIFFTITDTWYVMAEPFTDIGEWYQQRLMDAGRLPAASLPGEPKEPDVTSGNTAQGTDVTAGEAGGIGREEASKVVESGGPAGPEGGSPNGQNQDGQTQDGQFASGQDGQSAGGQDGTQSGEQGPQTPEGGGQTPENGAPVRRSPDEVTYMAVEDDYFADAVFIGDSRTVGMFEYGGLENITTFYASTGLTVFKLFDSPVVTVPGEKEKQTIEQALSERQFSKIYLMIGINEMGRGTVDSFIEKYTEVLTHLQELQPDAIIYLQGIMKVTTARSDKGDYINNPGIEERNVRIEELADYNRVYYLDVNPLVCDETGGMISDYTFDGVHLKAQYIPIWKDFLKQHAVSLD